MKTEPWPTGVLSDGPGDVKPRRERCMLRPRDTRGKFATFATVTAVAGVPTAPAPNPCRLDGVKKHYCAAHSLFRFEGAVTRNSLCLIALLCTSVMAMAQQPATKQQPKSAQLARGLYLVTVGGCNDCHSPKVFTAQGPQLDTARLLSDYPADARLPALPAGVLGPGKWGAVTTPDLTAWVGPWGTSFAANLTPDPSGIGGWAPEIFISAMRTGKHLGAGRPILPPMPWAELGELTDSDLRAIFAYLQSLRPISNAVPAPVPPAGASAIKN